VTIGLIIYLRTSHPIPSHRIPPAHISLFSQIPCPYLSTCVSSAHFVPAKFFRFHTPLCYHGHNARMITFSSRTTSPSTSTPPAPTESVAVSVAVAVALALALTTTVPVPATSTSVAVPVLSSFLTPLSAARHPYCLTNTTPTTTTTTNIHPSHACLRLGVYAQT
jgi:hypothetical protein